MPTCELPENPDLEHLKNQAKTLQRAVRAGDGEALALVGEFHPRLGALAADAPELARFSRADALVVIARRYGFTSWSRLRQHMELVTRYSRWPHRERVEAPRGGRGGAVEEFLRLACLTYGADEVGRRDRARELLAADPEIATASIHTVATVGDVAAAAALLDRDPGQARREGGPNNWEPLLYVAYSRVDRTGPGFSTLEVARLLLAHGADPNAGYLWNGLYPFTALTGAFGEGEKGPINQPRHQYSGQLARLLLDAGADPNDSQALYNRQFLPADDHLALLFEYGLGTGSGGPWQARFAANHPSPAELVRDQLQWAAEDDLPSRVRLLLDNGVDPAGSDDPGGADHTAYELAIRAGNTEIAEMLLAAGAQPVALDPAQTLSAALMRADRASVDKLTGSDPTLTQQVISQDPGLIIRAAGMGRMDAVRLMVTLGFDVNVRRRVTPLHEAAGNGDLAMVKLLLELGADPAQPDSEHESTPQGWAQYGHHHEIVAYLSTLPA